jgi:manganese transport protein
MAVAFIGSAFIANPDWVQAASGLIPAAPDGSWLLIIALVGTNFSINAAFYSAYGTKERGRTGEAAPTIVALAGIFEPLAGPIGSTVFALGFFGAAFSSMIANAAAGGTMLSDALGRGPSSNSLTAKLVSASILAFGVVVTLVFQSSPVQLIVIAQALTVFVAPVLAALIILMANRRDLMGSLRNRWWQNVLGLLGLAAVIALSVRLLMTFVAGS